MIAKASSPPTIPQVHASEGPDRILQAVQEHGGVIIKEFLSKEQVRALDQDIIKGLENLKSGSSFDVDSYQEFHGRQTKRLTNLVTESATFRKHVLDKDIVYDVLDKVYQDDNKAYWMASGQAIEIGPGNKPQPLHRDLGQYRVFKFLGPEGPEAIVNFLIATTQFTDENGGTRVIPGSHTWSDFHANGEQADTVPAEMNSGDCLFISGKTVHGGGANRTANEFRRGVAFSFCACYLTPEEAYPFQISKELARTMSKRAQRSVGFRSLYGSKTSGLWQHNFSELADFLQMDV